MNDVRRRLLGVIGRHLPRMMCAGVALALVVRLTVRDRYRYVWTLYYGTPPAVLAAICLLAALVWRLRRRRRAAAIALVAAIAFGAWHFAAHTSFRGRDDVPDGAVRIVLWNTLRLLRGQELIISELQRFDADVIALTESGSGDGPFQEPWEVAFEGYESVYLGAGLRVFVRGEIVKSWRMRPLHRTRALVVTARVKEQEFSLLLFDFVANPLRGRASRFAAAREWAQELTAAGPCVILGDFNTPAESLHFDEWREELRLTRAFEAAGDGYDATWPRPFPVLAIDQIWCGPGVTPLRCSVAHARGSDHYPVVAELLVE